MTFVILISLTKQTDLKGITMKKLLTTSIISLALSASVAFSSVASDNLADEVNSQSDYNKEITDIVFYYTPDALAFYSGDLEKLHNFIKYEVINNNSAFDGGSIPIARRIAAILPATDLPSSDWANLELTNFDVLATILKGARVSVNEAAETVLPYKASHYVVITGKRNTTVNNEIIGYAVIGGAFAVIVATPEANYLLSHELGHNDGLMHNVSETPLLTPYAIGASCGDKGTIMSVSPALGIFSNPELENDGNACGQAGVADVAASYKESMDTLFANRISPFRYNETIRERTGTATLSLPSVNVDEGENLTVEIHWDNAPVDASIELYTQSVVSGASLDDYDQTLVRIHYTGESITTFNIATTDDDAYELDELLSVGIRYGSGVSTQNNVEAVTISSDDTGQPGAFDLSVKTLTITEGSSKEITINRTGGSDGDISIRVYTESDTATSSDFAAIDESIIFLDGETSKTITIETVNDTANEGNEAFTLNIEADASLLGSDTTTTVTIDDSADVPAVVVTPPTVEKSSSGGGSSSIFVLLSLMGILIARRK
mgnify:CR=1 FL=1|tara:strand:- start:2086 stop:3735 length:1650 start_codon:yes stop_codon:yes gene_type:complete